MLGVERHHRESFGEFCVLPSTTTNAEFWFDCAFCVLKIMFMFLLIIFLAQIHRTYRQGDGVRVGGH